MEQETFQTNKKIKYILENKKRFFDPKKTYKLKESLCTKTELVLYQIISEKLEKNYIVFPQINLQTIIETDSIKRNDELYRNLDFCIFEKDTLKPVLAIELNGKVHNDIVVKERDLSVQQILRRVNLPLITLQIQELYNKNTIEVFDQIKAYLTIKN